MRAVLLDAGGVILLPNLEWLAERAAEHGLELPGRGPFTPEDLVSAYYRTIYEIDSDPAAARRGAALTNLAIRVWFMTRLLTHAGAPRYIAREAGRLIAERAAAELPRESDLYHWALPGTRGRLEALREAGFLLGVASNNDGALEAQLRSVGMVDLFGSLRDSGIEGVSKPDPELLLRAARDLGVEPAACLFVGDVDRIDGEAARAASMAFALLDPLCQPRESQPLCIGGLDEILLHFCPPSAASVAGRG